MRRISIPPHQIEAACRLLRVPLARRARVAADVRYMGDVVSSECNLRAESQQGALP
jgi:hypothetical protein